MEKDNLSRRDFLCRSIATAGLLVMGDKVFGAEKDMSRPLKPHAKSGFTLWQIPSHKDTIGNSYVMRTSGGKVIVMDGGYADEAFTLRGFLGALGNEVEAWFISHPHEDHLGALHEIMLNPQDLKIKKIYHSRIPEAVRLAEKGSAEHCRQYYETMDRWGSRVEDIQVPGRVFQFDNMYLKILSVANDFTNNAYNNSSMIMRVWDKRKSVTFLGDAGVECGQKVLAGPYGKDLDCEYMQMAHHGQQGCNKTFYDTVKFRACLWSTPLWVWDCREARLKTKETRAWMDELGIKEHHVTCLEGLWRLD